jgi:hypothetical protein
MLNRRVAVTIAILLMVSVGAAACSSSSSSSSTTAASTTASTKAAFCGANDQLDESTANVTTLAGFLAYLKAHPGELKTIEDNAPTGQVGQQVHETVSTVKAAIAANNPNLLNNLPSGGAIDTYCGVDGEGKPLPTYFGTGKGSTFCTMFLPIFQAVGNASNSAGVLAALDAHKTQVTQLASELSTLPSSIKSEANETVQKAQTAIASNNPSAIKGSGSGAASNVALYCGQNQ